MATCVTRSAALKAWKLQKGTHEVTDEQNNQFSVVRHSKFVLVFDDLNGCVVAFPKPEHMEVFENALSGVRHPSPGLDHPGSIGSIKTSTLDGDICILQAQSHFKQDSTNPVPENLARKYSAWRKVALGEIIARAKRGNVKVYITNNVVAPSRTGNPGKTNPVVLRELEEIAQRHNTRLLADCSNPHVISHVINFQHFPE